MPCHQVSTLWPANRCWRKLIAQFGGVSWSNHTRLPRLSMIIGPQGPTGWIVIALLLSGWTVGEGSGVRKMSSLEAADVRLRIVIFGGARLGREMKC